MISYTALGQLGGVAAMAISAVGSGMGAGIAGQAAVGAWKRCFIQNKPAPFQLAVFVGAPLSQTIYGMILMLLISNKAKAVDPSNWLFLLLAGIIGGCGMAVSAYMQGKAAAGCCDAFAETGKGFTNNLLVLGVIETVALFVMVFVIIALAAI